MNGMQSNENCKNFLCIDDSHQASIREVAFFVVLTFMVMVVVALLPPIRQLQGLKDYLPLHMILETVSIVIAMLIFAVGWSTYSNKLPTTIVLLSSLFFGVGVLDFTHVLSYNGMPDFVTPSGIDKGIAFWLAARVLSSVGLLLFVALPIRTSSSNSYKYVSIGLVLLIVGVFHWFILSFPDSIISLFFIPGLGLTALKINTEYAIIALNLIAAVVLLYRMRQTLPYQAAALLSALLMMAMSEFFFAIYADVTDIYNIFGHIYKAIAFLFVYRAIFVTAVEKPYKELEASQQQLRENNQLLSSIIDNIPHMIFLKRASDLRYKLLNKGGEDLLGVKSKEILGLNDYDLFSKEKADFFIMKDRETLQSNEVLDILEEPIETPHGIRLLHTKKMSLKDENGTPQFLLGISQDITKQKQLERELIEQENLMIAQSRHVAMGEMIGMIAHQWRQPITVIAMGANNVLADIALQDVSIERFAQEAKDILKQTEYLSKTIDDFRNFFRPNKEKDEVKVQDILLEAKQVFGKSLEYHNIELSIASDEHEAIRTYSRELLQVLLNLLKNAKEALETSKIENGYINATVQSLDNSIIIRICDNGGGIKDTILEWIFEPYFSTKDKKTGTGLGLYMSKIIIEKHLNGTISAYNTNEGACFLITISKESKTKVENV